VGNRYDLALPLLTLFLLMIGLLTLSSVASPLEFNRQLIGAGIAIVPLGLLLWLGRDRIFRFSAWLYLLSLLLLVLTLVMGREVNGAKNWLVLGPIQFQPLELAKLALILSLAKTMREGYRDLFSYLPIALLALPVMALVGKEDLGGALVLAVTVLCMMLVWKMPIKHFVLGLVAVAILFPTVIFPHLKPYQQTRLTIFFNPDQDPRGTGYQIKQSVIAVGSGGMMGKGYKQGTQTRGGFVPAKQTDFIFSGVAEEQGFVGGIFLLCLFGGMFWRLSSMANESPRLQDQLVIAGVLGVIGVQALENIGAALSMLPLTGITLPLISYGSSSLISVLTALGVVYVIYRDRYQGML
jgi:rod shape determining protein RodA